MYAAWRNAVDVVENTPPPPPAGDDSRRTDASPSLRKAHSSTVFLSPEETAVAVLGFQHEVATSAFDLLDGAKGTLRDAVSTTMFAALNRRDKAIVYIHNRPVPPPPLRAARTRTRRRPSRRSCPTSSRTSTTNSARSGASSAAAR